MANNFTVKDSTGATLTLESVDTAGVHAPTQNVKQSGAWLVVPYLQTNGSGALTPYSLISAATTNAASVKGSAATLGSVVATNNSSTEPAYLKLYNKASAPTVGTDIPVQVYMLAPNGGVAISFETGMAFLTGLAIAVTKFMTNSDATAIAANQVAVSLGYK